jgi:hypothetical protein
LVSRGRGGLGELHTERKKARSKKRNLLHDVCFVFQKVNNQMPTSVSLLASLDL